MGAGQRARRASDRTSLVNHDEKNRPRRPLKFTQVFAPPLPCRRVISERRKTLLKRSWQDEETCSMSVELTRRIVTGPSAWIDAWRLAPRT